MNVSYDLDTSGGLMPYIHALIKPPDEDSSSVRPKKSQHPYYRRPGKGHNHDCCDACQEGGDLICCDKCPASFHLGCHDPPLEECDIPLGQWLCLECRSSLDRRPTSPTTSHRSYESTGNASSSGQDKRSRSLRLNRSNSAVSSASSSSRKNDKERDKDVEMKDVSDSASVGGGGGASASGSGKEKVGGVVGMEAEKEEELSPIEVLIRAARVMNPTQFQLPREMQVYCPFPGTDKPVERNGKPPPLAVSKDSNGLVPLPAKLCFYCARSCRVAPLLQCDYCPLLFHQDCLDPPMTALPSGRWMCPNHVEQFIDWQLVNSISATERIALWDRMSGPVDHHAVRMDFLRKCRGLRRPFRVRVASLPQKGRVSVPAMVKHHYKKPPSLLPSKRDAIRCRNVMQNYGKYAESDEETNDKKKTICMNLNCPRYLSNNAICSHDSDSEDSLDEQSAHAVEDLKAITEKTTEDSEMKDESIAFVKESETPAESKKLSSPRRRKKEEDFKKESIDDVKKEHEDVLEKKICLPDNKEYSKVLDMVDDQLKKLDEGLVKLLAYQRLQQLMEGSPIAITGEIDDNVAELIKSSIDRSSLTKYGFKHVALPSELLNKNDLERISREITGAVAPSDEVVRLRRPPRVVPPTPIVPPPASSTGPAPMMLNHAHMSNTPTTLLPHTPTPSLSALPVKATLCPVERPSRNGLGDGLGRPVPMRLSRLLIGLGGGCDLQLQNYGHCNYVSEHHAIIFYDDVTHHYELMNYSEYGSVVNGQIYSCDFSDKTQTSSGSTAVKAEVEKGKDETPQPNAEERAAALREIANKRRGTVESKEKNKRDRGVSCPCRCSAPPCDSSLLSGWEGGAILQHGSLLQFGCLMFVFSITDVHLTAASNNIISSSS